MRVVVIVIAALMTLGLAAFGIGVAQKSAGSASLVALAVHAAAPAQTATAQPTPVVTQSAPARVVRTPVIQVSESTMSSGTPPVAAATATAAPAPAATPGPAPTLVAQNAAAAAAPASAPAPTPAAASAASAPSTKAIPACSNPNALGLSRVVEIDTTGGPGFGFEHFKQYDFLRDKEIVLTFDDGPWPENTAMVLKALTDNCSKATFFEIGEHAIWHPEIAKMVAAAGMTIGSHTWSHKDLAKNPYAKDPEQAKQEIEMGISAVHMAVDGPIASFFRFPDLQHPPEMLSYLAERNIATISTDIDSFDFKIHKPDDVIKSVMTKLAKRGKGIILMHDFQHATAEAMPELLHQLQAAGYKVVHMVSKQPVTPLPKYDDMVRAQDKLSVTNTRPESSVVKTISE